MLKTFLVTVLLLSTLATGWNQRILLGRRPHPPPPFNHNPLPIVPETDETHAAALLHKYYTYSTSKQASKVASLFYNDTQSMVRLNNLIFTTHDEALGTYFVTPDPVVVTGYNDIFYGFQAYFEGLDWVIPLTQARFAVDSAVTTVNDGRDEIGKIRYIFGAGFSVAPGVTAVAIVDGYDEFTFKRNAQGKLFINKLDNLEQTVILGENATLSILNSPNKLAKLRNAYNELKQGVLYQSNANTRFPITCC